MNEVVVNSPVGPATSESGVANRGGLWRRALIADVDRILEGRHCWPMVNEEQGLYGTGTELDEIWRYVVQSQPVRSLVPGMLRDGLSPKGEREGFGV
jgi:hypothetical protein